MNQDTTAVSIETATEKLCGVLNEKLIKYYSVRYPNLVPGTARMEIKQRFIAVYKDDWASRQGSIWFFVDRVGGMVGGKPSPAGSILKPAGYKAPAAHPRGNVLDESTWGCVGPHGVAYLRGGNLPWGF